MKRYVIVIAILVFVCFLLYKSGLIAKMGTKFFFGQKEVIWEPPIGNKSVTDTVRITLDENEYVYKLKVMVRGKVNDTILVNDIKLLPGIVDSTIYSGDWYQGEYIVNCSPCNSNEGQLKIKLIFYY